MVSDSDPFPTLPNHITVSNGYAQTQQSPRPENPLRLYVGNLPNIEPQESLENELKALFTGFQIQKVSRLVAPHESKAGEPGNHYYCFLDFATAEEADQAMEAFNGKESPWGAELRINKARDNRTRRQYGGGRDSHTRTNGEGSATAGGAWR
jgi:RNA recognition motif-containing protein